MKITKREFIQIAMGGVTADALIAKVDETHGIPHIPSRSSVKSVIETPIEKHDPYMNFWGKYNHADKMVIVPGLLYSRFDSSELRNLTGSQNYVEVGDPVIMTDGFKQGYCGFDAFHPSTKSDESSQYTNLYDDTLRAPEYFAAFGATIILDRSTSDTDLKLFERWCRFDFLMGTRSYAKCPALRITNRVDSDLVIRRDGKPTEMMPSRMHRWDPPLIIEHNMYFHFLIRVSKKGLPFGDFSGYAMLDGYYAQGVC